MIQLSETMRAVLDRVAAEDADLPDPTTLDPQHGRALVALTNARWNLDLPAMEETRTVIHAGLPGRLVVPPNDTGRDAILHFHGGGWAFGSVHSHEGTVRRLALTCRAPVLSVEYRLAPEHPWPAGLDDATRAFCATGSSRRWSIAGDSAGANLALCTTIRLMNTAAPRPAQALLFYGVYGSDLNTLSYQAHADGPRLTRDKMSRYWDMYAPQGHRNNPEIAPLAASDATLADLPPLYMNAAELDPLRSDTEHLCARLRALGRNDPCDVVPGVVHGFMHMGACLPEAETAFERAGEVFRQNSTDS